MKRILFLGTMEGAPWGGSEELWYNAAVRALQDGNPVMVSLVRWQKEHRKVASLREKGAQICYRPKYRHTASTFAVRLYNKVSNLVVKRKWFAQILRFGPEAICVSQGGTFDVLRLPEVLWLIRALNKPYFLISQHNVENGGTFSNLKSNGNIDFILNATKFFFVSKRNFHIAQRQLALPIRNAAFVDNPVNLTRPEVKQYRESKTLKLANVARLECQYKGQDILLHALSGDVWKSRDFVLNLFGDGPDKDYIERLISFYDLQDKVKLKGHVSDVGEIWDSHQALVLASLSEGTPLSMLEAMLCGRAVVATDVGDIGKYVIDGKTGFLAPCASVKEISRALDRAWESRNELSLIGRTAYEHAMAKVNLDAPNELLRQIMLL